ncbi:MAG: condensation domain-containing protein [Pseudomonadales bacterium]
MPSVTQQPVTAESSERVGGAIPLTREQEGLWVEWKLSPLGVSYNTCIQMKLSGPLDAARFERAAAAVVDHFELLRAYCVEGGDRPHFALSARPFRLEHVDLCDGENPEDEGRRAGPWPCSPGAGMRQSS